MPPKLRLILKQNNKWKEIVIPEPESMTGAIILTWQGKPCRFHYNDGVRDFYAFGEDSVKWPEEDQKVTMTVDHFSNFWCYELLKFGIDTFTRLEMAEERVKICEADNVPAQAIQQILLNYPLNYET
jgi:hypothetical protein